MIVSYNCYDKLMIMKVVLQALELIQELQKHYPIKRCPLRVRAAAPEEEVPILLEKLSEWKATVISKEGTAAQLSVVSSLCCSVISWFHFILCNPGFSVLEALL
jgi:hypothetical protein